MGVARDLKGQRFGHLLVLNKEESRSGMARWQCQCDCGATPITYARNLLSGKSTSCGCYGKPRKNVKSEYNIWLNQRKNMPDYWQDFDDFLMDVGAKIPNSILARKNKLLPHSKENTYWQTPNERKRIDYRAKSWFDLNTGTYGIARETITLRDGTTKTI